MENLLNFQNFIIIWHCLCFTFYKVSVARISSHKKSFSFYPFYCSSKTQITIQNKITSSCCKSIFYKPIRQSRLEYDIYVFNIFKHKTFSFLLQLNAKCSLHVLNKAINLQVEKKSIGFLNITKVFRIQNWMKLPLLGKGLFHVFYIFLYFHRLFL